MKTLASLAGPIGDALKARGETIAVAESSTGGLVSAALLAVPGASAYFLGGGVIYTREARRALLGLGGDVLTMRASTQDYALLLARTIRDRFDANWAIGESGAAGPTGNSYGDAPGHVCIAVAGQLERAITIETGDNDREANMQRFAEATLDLFTTVLDETNG